jgi:pSer/pThr/pTyr-binding forkhead associated (FHA) protein/type II secretory pathway predicted ATPase ExeA
MRYASLKLGQLLEGKIHSLFLSGAAGVGKTTLVEQELRGQNALNCCWVNPGLGSAEELLQQLTKDLGPASIEGTAVELRNILQVYLLHQAGNQRRSLIVVDSLDRHSTEVLREFQSLSQFKLRNRPVLQFLFISRNEELVGNFMAQHDPGPFAQVIHQRLTGFTLEETSTYIRASLEGGGCVWCDELMPEESLLDVQAFTRGIVGDIDALCHDALDVIAARQEYYGEHPRVARKVLKQVGEKLHLRYDASAWKRDSSETLSPDAVQTSAHRELKIEPARLLVSSGGRLVAEVSLDQPRMVMGRDRSCDISLNSNYVSRYQNLFMETDDGWVLIDLNSTNGCFVNGQRIREHRLRDGDLISLGQHQLRFTSSNAIDRRPRDGHGQDDTAEKTIVGLPS